MDIIGEYSVDGENFTVRKATFGDYQGVVDISHFIYDGLDYIPSNYKEYVHDPQWLLFVVETKGKIVGFKGIYIMDQGEALLHGAARMCDSYKGQGVFGGFNNTLKKVTKEYPDVEHVWVALHKKEIYDRRMQKNPGITLVSSWKYAVFQSSKASLIKERNQLSTQPSRLLSPEVAQRILCPEQNLLNLFKGQSRFIVGSCWFPLKVNRENLENTAKTVSVFGVLDDAGLTANGIAFLDVHMTMQRGLAAFFSYYGSSNLDVCLDLLKSVWKHLMKISPDTDINLFCHLPMHVDKDSIVKEVANMKICVLQNDKTDLFKPDCVSIFKRSA